MLRCFINDTVKPFGQISERKGIVQCYNEFFRFMWLDLKLHKNAYSSEGEAVWKLGCKERDRHTL